MTYKNLLLLFILISAPIVAQDYLLDSIREQYPFVNWKANTIKFAEDSPAFAKLYQKLNTIAKGGEDDVHVFHIGGSHIQADMYSNRLRSYLQQMSATAKGQRGFIFPYRMAKTNNPGNYKVTFDGKWKGYRCSISSDSIAWGLSGISAQFKDSLATVVVKANHRNYKDSVYDFNKIRIFYNDWQNDYQIVFADSTVVQSQRENKQAHFIEYALTKTVDQVEFCIQRTGASGTSEFLMMGLELINDNTGVEYTSIGVNGASFAFYDRCQYFEEQLQLYTPDLFIISIGTNDTYTTNFKPKKFRAYYEAMILAIQKANPDCAILLTVPNDSYYKQKYPNPNTKVAAKVIYELAQQHKMAVWDFYEIMGGFNSSRDWYQHKLMPKDRIHFTRLGYHIKGDLLLEALSHSWEQSLQLTPNTILNQIIHE